MMARCWGLWKAQCLPTASSPVSSALPRCSPMCIRALSYTLASVRMASVWAAILLSGALQGSKNKQFDINKRARDCVCVCMFACLQHQLLQTPGGWWIDTGWRAVVVVHVEIVEWKISPTPAPAPPPTLSRLSQFNLGVWNDERRTRFDIFCEHAAERAIKYSSEQPHNRL